MTSESMSDMDDWYDRISAYSELSARAVKDLEEVGFIIIPGPVPPEQLPQLSNSYDCAVLNAQPGDVSFGSSTTRINDFVNRGQEFDCLYIHGPILEACCRTIRQPFKLSTMHARTVRPHASAQDLHVDFKTDGHGWPMVGFILMVDEFRNNNGATRFLPGSHRMPGILPATSKDEVPACGPAGALIVYNGSVLHGHGANSIDSPRRSIQGSFIRRDAESAANKSTRIHPDTLFRLGDLARYLLVV